MKSVLIIPTISLSIILYPTILFSNENADVIVAQDGSGDFTTIQAAIDAAPRGTSKHFVILIKNGVYNEKLFIVKNFIALVGEDRDSTIIVTAELRDIWRETHSNDWGVATINIQNGVSDLVLANLTALNNFAEVNPNHPGKNGHTMTIRGGGNRVIIVNCNIIATGGDTCSLWGQGDYYHKDCYFEGYVDYVCPRGWCYITDCYFFGYNTGASIWLDGRDNPDKKLVVQNSYFDGIQNFGLGRYHRDAQFYLLNCTLSENVNNNGGILKAGSEPLLWGERVYYYNTHRETGDYDWHKDNLIQAEGRPTPEEIRSTWTFRNEWDPETDMPAVLPFAYMPKPSDSQIKVDLVPTLTWIPGRNAVSHDVYFGTMNPPMYQTNVAEANYEPGTLTHNTVYYWRINEVTEQDVIEGPVWQFRTETDQRPTKVTNPSPLDKANDVKIPIERFNWDMNLFDTDTVKVYLGISPDSLKLVHVYTVPGYVPGSLMIGQTYYWRIDVINKIGKTPGDLWSFTTEKSQYDKADYEQKNDSDGIVSIEVEDYTDNIPINEHTWTFITDPDGYSGRGAMQALSDNGTFIFYKYSERSARLDYAVNFIQSGTHYVWIRGFSRDNHDNYLHIGLNGLEIWEASRIGSSENKNQWQWLNASATSSPQIRTIEVQALGVQSLNLWFGKDGAIADKIVLTTNPDYVPTGLGPNSTITDVQAPAETTKPEEFRLIQNYPNPFNPNTTISYYLPEARHVSLSIFDIQGRLIAKLVNRVQQAGQFNLNWNTSTNNEGITSGIYFARLNAGSFVKTIKMTLLK